ncbi:hypothetical protein BH09ACT7_BH09ACT7_22460 [soil metagenome]
MRCDAAVPQSFFQVAYRLLPGADDDVVDGQHLPPRALPAEADVHALIVDEFIVHTGKLLYPFGFQ